MKTAKPNSQNDLIKGVGILKKMLDDKKVIFEPLANGGKLADLKDKCKFVSPLKQFFTSPFLKMNKASSLRNNIIENVMNIEDVEYLKALKQLLKPTKSNLYKLNSLQKVLISQSLKEADAGYFISQEEVEAQQIEWLKAK